MLNPIITPPRVPLVDPDTGLINRAWYLFFLSLNNVTNAVVDNPDVGPNADSLIASYDAALQALAQNVDTQPLPTDLSAELTKQIEAAGLVDQSQALLSQIAEMQKQIDALNLLPLPPQSNLTSGTSILYGNGSGGFSNVTIGTGVAFTGGTLSATAASGLAGGTTNSVVYQSAPSTTAFLAAPSTALLTESGDTLVTESGDPLVLESPSYLQYTNGALSWGLTYDLIVANSAALSGGVLGSLPYQSATDVTSFVSPNSSTTRNFLRMVGTGTAGAAPVWDTVTKTDVGLGNVENTALSTWAGSTNITTLGTVSTGIWQGTVISPAYGGTGQTTYTDGQLLIGNTTGSTLAKATLTQGTGITIANGAGSITVTNSAPDQTVVLTQGGATTITGTYPNFTISSVNTTYNLATSTVLGLIELGSDTQQTVAANAVSATASRSYALQVNAAGQGVINVPWTDTNSGGTVTSVAALTLGTTGTDLSSTVANSTTTPVITLNVPTASAVNRGALSASDWTTFNSKQPAGSYVTLTGTETLQNKTLDDTNTVALKDTLFTLKDDVDPTKQAQFQLSGITTGTTRTYTLPNGSSTLVDLATTQTLNGIKTFSSATINNGSSTATGTMQFAYGATISGSTKTVNIATGGVSGSTTTVTFGSTFGTTTTFNGQTKIGGSFGRGAPVTKTANFTLADTENWLINNKSGSTCVVTLPAASSWVGREVTIKNMQAQLVTSASSNVVPIDSTTAGTAILLNVIGNWATMVSDGTNWVIMQAAANNNLLLE
jgi:hypothetical protein